MLNNHIDYFKITSLNINTKYLNPDIVSEAKNISKTRAEYHDLPAFLYSILYKNKTNSYKQIKKTLVIT